MLPPAFQERRAEMAVLRLVSAVVYPADLTGGLDVIAAQQSGDRARYDAARAEYDARFQALLRDLTATLDNLDRDPPHAVGADYAKAVFDRYVGLVSDETAHLQDPRPAGTYDVHAVADITGKMLAEFQRIYADIRQERPETVTAHIADIAQWLRRHAATDAGRSWLLTEAVQLFVADALEKESTAGSPKKE
jgi:hypothetical protein